MFLLVLKCHHTVCAASQRGVYVIECFKQSENRVTLQTTALENTSIKVGPARKASYKAKMARRSKKSKRKDGQERYATLFITF